MLSVEEFEQIARSVSDWTHHICLHVKGEPLMHPQLGELLAIAAHYGLQVNLTTNATLLSEKGHLLLGTHAPRQVSLSLHSFDANTLHWMDFDSYLSQAFDFARQFTSSTNGYISFRLWNLSTDADANQQKQNKYILKKIEQAYQLPEPIDDIRPKSQGNTLAPRTYLNFDYLFDWPDLLAPDFGTDGTCHGLRRQLAILADGSVVPCCLDNEGILTLGNIFSESLADILQKERSLRIIEGFQRRKITEPLCRHCGYRTRF
jgi:radical SAM protein with 4Fe4S-binding SPASM domain